MFTFLNCNFFFYLLNLQIFFYMYISTRDLGLIPGLGRSSGGEGMATHFQYSCLENPTDQGSLVGYSP